MHFKPFQALNPVCSPVHEQSQECEIVTSSTMHTNSENISIHEEEKKNNKNTQLSTPSKKKS